MPHELPARQSAKTETFLDRAILLPLNAWFLYLHGLGGFTTCVDWGRAGVSTLLCGPLRCKPRRR
jgi:hypothetical protein